MNTEKSVIFYGAGCHAHHVFKELREKYSPVAFCDGDKSKWGSILYNLPVMSLTEVLEKYPGSAFYVTADGGVKFEIVNTLIQNNISPDRILNYEQMKKYKSCQYLEEWMMIGENISFCCADFGKNRPPTVDISENHEKTLENFFL